MSDDGNKYLQNMPYTIYEFELQRDVIVKCPGGVHFSIHDLDINFDSNYIAAINNEGAVMVPE